MPTQKKKGISMKGSYLKVWTDKNGDCHSKAKGNMKQIQNNFDTMIVYLQEQAKAMNISAVRTLGNEIPDAIVGTMTRDPKMTPQYRSQTTGGPYNGGGSGSKESINDNKK